MTAEGWAIIISAAGIVLVNAITAWKAGRDSLRASEKLDTIHLDTNSRLERQDAELKRVYRLLSEEKAKGGGD